MGNVDLGHRTFHCSASLKTWGDVKLFAFLSRLFPISAVCIVTSLSNLSGRPYTDSLSRSRSAVPFSFSLEFSQWHHTCLSLIVIIFASWFLSVPLWMNAQVLKKVDCFVSYERVDTNTLVAYKNEDKIGPMSSIERSWWKASKCGKS